MLNELPIYVICLKRDPARVERLINHLAPFNFNYKTWWGFDGKKMGLATTKAFDLHGHQDNFCECGCGGQKGFHVSEGQIGCVLSHLSLMKHFLAQGYEKALIFEDDVDLPNNFKELFEERMNYMPNDWDMVFLDYYSSNPSSVNAYVAKMHCTCTNAYMLNKTAMQIIEDTCQYAYRPIDMCMEVEAQPKLNVYGFTPPICSQLTREGKMPSTI